jgi:hypothetical protein
VALTGRLADSRPQRAQTSLAVSHSPGPDTWLVMVCASGQHTGRVCTSALTHRQGQWDSELRRLSLSLRPASGGSIRRFLRRALVAQERPGGDNDQSTTAGAVVRLQKHRAGPDTGFGNYTSAI